MCDKENQINILNRIRELCEARRYDEAISMTNQLSIKTIAIKAHLLCMEHEEATRRQSDLNLKIAIRLAKRWNNSKTEFNKIQFLDAFNALKEGEQVKAIAKGSEISRILIGWSSAARSEIGMN